MIKGDVIFVPLGVTNGDLAKGVKDLGNKLEVLLSLYTKAK